MSSFPLVHGGSATYRTTGAGVLNDESLLFDDKDMDAIFAFYKRNRVAKVHSQNNAMANEQKKEG